MQKKKKTISFHEHRYVKNEKLGFYVIDMGYENWKWKELQRKIEPKHTSVKTKVSPYITKKVRVSLI